MRKIIIISLCFSLFFSLQVLSAADASAGEARIRNSECDLAGLWYTVTSSGRKGLVTFVPLDPTGRRLASLGEAIEPFSEGEYSNSRGLYVRTAPGTYWFTFYMYDINSDMKIVTSGELTMSTATRSRRPRTGISVWGKRTGAARAR